MASKVKCEMLDEDSEPVATIASAGRGVEVASKASKWKDAAAKAANECRTRLKDELGRTPTGDEIVGGLVKAEPAKFRMVAPEE